MSKKLDTAKLPELEVKPQVPTPEEEAMLQQSMTALQQQEEMEQEAYANGDMNSLYGVDSYQVMPNNDGAAIVDADANLPEVDPEVTAQQQQDAASSKYTNVFASLFNKLSTVFGEDSAIGSKLKEIADNLQGTYGQNAEEVQQQAMQERMMRGQSGLQGDVSETYVPDAQTQAQWQEQQDLSNQNMIENADTLVQNDEFVKLADAKDGDFDRMTSGMTIMHQRLGEDAMVQLSAMDSGAEQKASVANNYMTMMRGIKSYNDEALSGIETKYADDPEKLELAKQGLGNLMSRAADKAYAATAGDNYGFDFLSEKDVQELDAMQLQGVDKTYSQYVAENHLQPQGQMQDDMSLYANAMDMKSAEVAEMSGDTVMPREANYQLKNYGGPQIDSRMAGKETTKSEIKLSGSDRGAQAEERFSTILQNEQAAQKESLLGGLER